MPQYSLNNKKVLVTGVSRAGGIGASIVTMLAHQGAQVAAHGFSPYDTAQNYSDATPNYLQGLPALHSGALGRVISLSSDLSEEAAPTQLIAEASNGLGGLDCLVLNHAYSTHAPIGTWTAAHIDAHLQVNVRASMLLIQAFLEQFEGGDGSIVLFTSGQYLGPMVSETAYAVSKDAIIGLCRQMAVALAEQNIRVNCINPGPTDTGYLCGAAYEEVREMFPTGRWGLPRDAAKLVCFLLSDASSWITGQVIGSEGGFNRYR